MRWYDMIKLYEGDGTVGDVVFLKEKKLLFEMG